MKVTIVFNMPEDKEDLKLAQQAGEMYSALWAIMEDVLRQRIKYNDAMSEEVREELIAIQTECRELIGGLLD